MSKIKRLVALKYGETYIDEGMAYRGGDRTKKLPISLIIYLLETDSRKILVDAGCDTMPGFELFHFCSPVEVLGRLGIGADEITDLILTHAHHDHAEATHHYKNATVHIESGEISAARGFIPESMTLEVFSDRKIIDDCVEIIKIGGHSKGSCIVEFDYKGKKYVICGDECYVRRCLDEKIPTGASLSKEISLEFVKIYGNGQYSTLLCHDYEILTGQNGAWEF